LVTSRHREVIGAAVTAHDSITILQAVAKAWCGWMTGLENPASHWQGYVAASMP
jgi:hypothetical protein